MLLYYLLKWTLLCLLRLYYSLCMKLLLSRLNDTWIDNYLCAESIYHWSLYHINIYSVGTKYWNFIVY
jgi:hypothetical protein